MTLLASTALMAISATPPPCDQPIKATRSAWTNERLLLQEQQSGIGVLRPLLPHRDRRLRWETGLAEAAWRRAVDDKHDVTLVGQGARPGRIKREEPATRIEKSGAPMHHDH
jgi:hypothetical protein